MLAPLLAASLAASLEVSLVASLVVSLVASSPAVACSTGVASLREEEPRPALAVRPGSVALPRPRSVHRRALRSSGTRPEHLWAPRERTRRS